MRSRSAVIVFTVIVAIQLFASIQAATAQAHGTVRGSARVDFPAWTIPDEAARSSARDRTLRYRARY